MRFKRHIELEHGLKQIVITPVITVVFLLLIFYMLASSLEIQSGISVKLPKAITSEAVTYDNVDIVISGENVTFFNGKVITMDEVPHLLTVAAKRNQSVLIKSDKRASLGKVVEIWDMCRDAGISQINIATNQE